MAPHSVSVSRRTLLVFTILSIIFLAQMSWWIIFHVRNSHQNRDLLINTLEQEAQLITALLNSEYDHLYRLARLAAGSGDERRLSGLTDHPAVSGAVRGTMVFPAESLYIVCPTGNDSLYLFLDRAFPKTFTDSDDHLVYIAPSGGYRSGRAILTAANITVNPAVADSLHTEHARHVRMFLMEGAFFIVLILIGTYLIYLALRRARQNRAEQNLFVHSITHELKIPITSLGLFLDTIRRRQHDPALTAELMPKMKADLNRLSGLIDNILQVRHLWDRKGRSNPQVINLSEEVKSYCRSAAERIEAAGATLKYDIEDNIRIKGNTDEIIRVWNSLLDNALKYARPEKPAIDIALAGQAGQAVLTIRDNGPGITTGEAARLFDQFARGDSEDVRRIPGSGLGLYIAREYTRRNGGRISIDNADGGGCRVTMRFNTVS